MRDADRRTPPIQPIVISPSRDRSCGEVVKRESSLGEAGREVWGKLQESENNTPPLRIGGRKPREALGVCRPSRKKGWNLRERKTCQNPPVGGGKKHGRTKAEPRCPSTDCRQGEVARDAHQFLPAFTKGCYLRQPKKRIGR